MRKFRERFEDLKDRVAVTEIDGEWIERGQHKQYRADSGAILNFWESTRTVNFQGPESAAQELEAAVFRSDGKNAKAAKPKPNSSGSVVDDEVLKGLTSAIIENRVGSSLDDQSVRIGKVARQCMFDLCEQLGIVKQRKNRKLAHTPRASRNIS